MNWFQAILLKWFPKKEETSKVLTNEFEGRQDRIKEVQILVGVRADGISGKQTLSAIAQLLECDSTIFAIQRQISVSANGIDDEHTWERIHEEVIEALEEDEVETYCGLSKEAYKLIIYYETGGKAYYNRALKSPTYPGGASGVTIGIGYDIGYNTRKQFESDWKPYLEPKTFDRLAAFLGKKGSQVKEYIPGLKDIEISWPAAQAVFQKRTLPRFIDRTKKAFPGSEKLDPNIFGALVSIVFNRGGSMRGSTRREMANIRAAIESGEYSEVELKKYISDQVRHMKRLWANKNLDGLLARRDAEADLILS